MSRRENRVYFERGSLVSVPCFSRRWDRKVFPVSACCQKGGRGYFRLPLIGQPVGEFTDATDVLQTASLLPTTPNSPS